MKKHMNVKGPGGIMLKCDATEIFPDDPGNGTPLLVVLPFGKGTGTFWCASETGEVDGVPLSDAQMEWLDALNEPATQWHDNVLRSMEREGRDAILKALE